MISPSSRYQGIGTATWTGPDGREHPYLLRRFLPNASDAIVLSTHVWTQGDRLDNVTAQFLGDPEQFWRVCDANNAMSPDDLDVVGRTLIIPLPQKG
jgi:hypothetical protein